MSIENALESLIGELEQDRSLNELWHLRQRVEALDQLDVYTFGRASQRNSPSSPREGHLH
jgi:hypothetical protein